MNKTETATKPEILELLDKSAQESKHIGKHKELELPEDFDAQVLNSIATISNQLIKNLPGPWVYYLSARKAFRSDAELAEELGVNRSSVTRWKKGLPADQKNEDMLRDLTVVISLLTGYIESSVIPDWLHGLNPMLGNRRPIDVIKTGRLSEVISTIEAEKSGAFA